MVKFKHDKLELLGIYLYITLYTIIVQSLKD